MEETVPAKDRYGRTELFLAVEKNDIQRINEILQQGHPPDMQSCSGQTPLHYAARFSGDGLALELLIDSGHSVDLPDGKGWTPLHYGTYYANTVSVRVLLMMGACPLTRDCIGRSPMSMAHQMELSSKTIELLRQEEVRQSTLVHLLWRNLNKDIQSIPSTGDPLVYLLGD